MSRRADRCVATAIHSVYVVHASVTGTGVWALHIDAARALELLLVRVPNGLFDTRARAL